MRGWFLMALMVATPALGQVDTTCTQTFGFTHCTSTERNRPSEFGWGDIIASRRKAARAREAAQDQANREAAFRNDISTLVSQGQCETAARVALNAGRYEAVSAIKQTCTPVAAQPLIVPAAPRP